MNSFHHHVKPHHHYATWAVVALTVILSASSYTNATLAQDTGGQNGPSDKTKAFFGGEGDHKVSKEMPTECKQAMEEGMKAMQAQQQAQQAPQAPAGTQTPPPTPQTTTTTNPTNYPSSYPTNAPQTSTAAPSTAPSAGYPGPGPSPSSTTHFQFAAPTAYPAGSNPSAYPANYSPAPGQSYPGYPAGQTGQTGQTGPQGQSGQSGQSGQFGQAGQSNPFESEGCQKAMASKMKGDMGGFHKKLADGEMKQKMENVVQVVEKLEQGGLKDLEAAGIKTDEVKNLLGPIKDDARSMINFLGDIKAEMDKFFNAVDSDPKGAFGTIRNGNMKDKAEPMAKLADRLVDNVTKLQTVLEKISNQITASPTAGGTNGQ